MNGGGAWIVGGAVRDAFMGYMPTDIDLATDLIPDKLLSIFPDAIQTGVLFGTITIKSGQFQYQTTTLRTDGDYFDSRRPADVKWNLSLFEDLKRRDFIDKNRKHSKLERHPESVYINTAKLNILSVLDKMSKHVDKAVNKYGK